MSVTPPEPTPQADQLQTAMDVFGAMGKTEVFVESHQSWIIFCFESDGEPFELLFDLSCGELALYDVVKGRNVYRSD